MALHPADRVSPHDRYAGPSLRLRRLSTWRGTICRNRPTPVHLLRALLRDKPWRSLYRYLLLLFDLPLRPLYWLAQRDKTRPLHNLLLVSTYNHLKKGVG